jgi:hypothetical protein
MKNAGTSVSGRDRIIYIAAAVLIILIAGYLVRKIFLPNPEVDDAYSNKQNAEDVKFTHVPAIPTHLNVPPTATTYSRESLPTTSVSQDETTPTLAGSQPDGKDHVEVFSKMTHDGKWFPIDFGDYGSYNPNLIPHPEDNSTWYMIAQGLQPELGAAGPRPVYSMELVCEAEYVDKKMKCKRSPISVPIASTASDHCTDSLSWFNYFIGPNDPRVFFGPDRPYITYGSASAYTCLGQWIHDLRRLVRWNTLDAIDRTQRFFWPTELQRPPPYGDIEKNWFAFWDWQGDMYLHYDILPKRSFAKVSDDGSGISEDLAPRAAAHDSKCLEQYMPHLKEHEHIHQATNSLAIVMCQRSSPECDVARNTYIFTIFHHKTYNENHNLYEPYLMIIRNEAPFEIHAISSKPFWISGRGKPGENWSSDPAISASQTQMMYITSVNWKERGLNYTGYLDDELMIAFGIEDKAAGGIDVTAEQLFKELNMCD